MKVVFWLDPKIGFDCTTPEVLARIADGLASLGYEVELLVEDQILDDYKVEKASRRVYYTQSGQQIVADLLICNSLNKLLRTDLQRVGGRMWLALEEDVTEVAEIFEKYQLHDAVQVLTLAKEIKNKLQNIEIDSTLIQPGLKLERFKSFSPKTKKSWGITVSFFGSNQEVLSQVLQGVEMASNSLNRLKVQLLTDREYQFKTFLTMETMIKPSQDERIKAYEKSDIIIHIPGAERFSLVPLEGMAVGLPVILLDHPGIKQYAKNRENSLIIKKINPTDIALSILNITKFGNIRQKLKSYGLQVVQNYDLSTSIKGLESLIDQMIPTKDDLVHESDNSEQEMVDIVVVNHNSGSGIKDCLALLRKYTLNTSYSSRIIVVDNGSSDESLGYLQKQEEITLIANQQNGGYAKACNQGILAGKGNYILLLHSDSKVTEGWLVPLLKAIKDPKVGMAVPRIITTVQEGLDTNEENLSGELEEIEAAEDSVERNLHIAETEQRAKDSVEFAVGCKMIKRKLLNQIGLLAEEFFLYCEEMDYSLRIKEKGYEIKDVPESVVIHDCDQAWQKLSPEMQLQRDKYLNESKKYFKEKWGTLDLVTSPTREVDGIILLSINPWQRKAQRTEAVMDYFTRQGQKIVYVEPYCSAAIPIVLGQGQYIYTPKGSGTIYHNLQNSGSRTEMIDDLKGYLGEWEIKQPLLWIEVSWWEPVLKHVEHLYQIYVAPGTLLGDDIETYQQLKARYGSDEESILETVDLIITGSVKEKEDLKKYDEKVFYSPGGFYPTDLERFLKGHYTVPDELFYLPGPKVGIVGTFNRYFPHQLLRRLAINNSDFSFVFIGEITCDLKNLQGISNLYFLGNKDWESLLDCLYFFDMMLYPHQDKNFNSHLDPYMINYYLAMGKPVVAFEHRELERFGSMIQLAKDEEEFVQLVSEATNKLEKEKSADKIKQRIHQIKGQSWEQKMDEIYDMILADVPLRQTSEIKITEELEMSESTEDKGNIFASLIKQIYEGYQRLFKGQREKE